MVDGATPVSSGVTFPAPADARQRQYLGLSAGAETFGLADVKADWLVVEVFDMYCHICQQSAPALRRLHDAVQKAGVGDRVRFLGVGLGNSPLEARAFARRFKFPFPAVPDRENQLRKLFPRLRASTLLVFHRQGDARQLFTRHDGLLRKKDADELAKKIIEAVRSAGASSSSSSES